MPLTPGTQLGPYEIVSALGAGGMGEVWLARDSRLARKVAIKVLPLELTVDPERVRRFEQEARAASSLNHANVCTIHALGEAPDGRQFIAMELIEGTTLRAQLSRGAVPLRQAVDIAGQVASALTAAHAAGVVHRDVKPENVMLRPDGVVKVLDFGLAKLAPISAADSLEATRSVLQTNAGTIMGTIAYMSPEQVSGQEVDARTDVWSLGVMLYELISRRLPFGRDAAGEMLVGILDREPIPVAQLVPNAPRELQRIVTKALRKDRDKRYQTVKDLFLDLQALAEELDTCARSPSGQQPAIGEATGTLVRRGKRPVAAALAALLAIAALAGWWVARTGRVAPAPLTPRGLTRLTVDPGLQSEITWSPDGRFIAYASDRAGNFDIWVQPVDGGGAVQLTGSPAHDRQPSWSPDGHTIVFERAGGGLFVIPARGGAERQVTDFGAEPKWAPDGSSILFVSGTVHALLVPRMFTVRLDGQAPQQVLQPLLENMRYVVSWNWYPDSKRVSLLGATRYSGEGLGVYTVPLSGEGAVLLKYTPEVGTWGGFAWSPSGRTLYIDCSSHAAHGLCKLEVEPATMTIRSTARIAAGAELQATPVLSRDGKRLAYTMTRASVRLWTFPFDSATGRVTGSGQATTDADLIVRTWALSHDGSRVSYVADRAGTNAAQLWVTDLTSGTHRRLADDDQRRITPQWSRDGAMLAYGWFEGRADERARQALAIRRMDTQEEQLISTPDAATGWAVAPFDWSPDGRWILASSVLPHPPVHSLTLWPLAASPRAEAERRTLAYDPNYDLWQAKYSPDGKWICFVATERQLTRGNTIFIMPSGGGDRSQWRPLIDSGEWADKPRWSPDGKMVYFVRYRNSFFNLWAVRFDSATGRRIGEPFQVTRFESPTRQISTDLPNAEIGVSRSRLVLTITEQTGNVWILDNVDR